MLTTTTSIVRLLLLRTSAGQSPMMSMRCLTVTMMNKEKGIRIWCGAGGGGGESGWGIWW